MYKSNKLITFGQKYGFLIFSSILIIAYLYLSLFPNTEITINGKIQQADYINSLPFLLFGVFFSILYFFYGKELVYVEMDNENIIIKKNRKTYKYSWKQVDKLRLSNIILPPTYKLTLKDNTTAYFCSGAYGLAIPFRVWDFSEMGNFIMKKKKEYRLDY